MKRVFIKTAVVLMVISMIAGCGGGTGGAQTTAPQQAQQTEAATTTSAAATTAAVTEKSNAGADEKAGETTTVTTAATTAAAAVTTAAADEIYEFTMFGNIAPEMLNGDKTFFEALGAQTNTKINVQLPPSSNYSESLTIMMAGGDYPELVLFQNHTEVPFVDGVRNGAILPLNQYLENAPNIMQYSYDISFKTLSILGDGVIYAIPRTSIARADGFALRRDWLDNVGLDFDEEKPITLDMFTEILNRFTYNDPDGNGQNDTYGLGLSSGDGNMNVPAPIAWTFGLLGWQEYTTEDYPYMDLQFSKKDDSYKRALEYTAELWSKKLIDPDWPTVLTQEAQDQRFYQGITGVKPEFAGWMPDREKTLRDVFPDGKMAYVVSVVLNEGGKGRGGSFSLGFWGQWAVMNTAKNPQKIVDVIDYMLSDNYWPVVNYGPEGVAWNYDGDGNRIAIPDSGYAGGRATVRRNNAPEFFVGLGTAIEDRERIANLINVCIQQSIFSQDAGFRPETSDSPVYIEAETARKLTVSKIITGDLPVSAYDDELNKWYAAGGQKYIEEMNAGIAASR